MGLDVTASAALIIVPNVLRIQETASCGQIWILGSNAVDALPCGFRSAQRQSMPALRE